MAMAKPWNPMEDAYKNQNFNKYTQGPGAEFDENLQPGAMASGGGRQQATDKRDERFQLCLKMVPSDMSEKALWNLCAHYGKVTYVKRSQKTPFVFVSFATLNDMERCLEGFRREKPQGICADVAKHTAMKQANNQTASNASTVGSDRRKDRDRHSDSGSSCQPDMTNRDSRETTDNLKRLSMNSKGSYNSEKDEFFKGSSQFDKDAEEIKYCNLCRNIADKVCQRCGDYYCSLECQRKDWSRHRLFCFPMPELVAPVSAANHSSSGRTEPHSPIPNLNESFERKSKYQGGSQNYDNRSGDNRQQQPQQRQQKFQPRENADNARNRNDNRPQYNNKFHEANNQENRKNAMNQNQNRNQGFDNRKDRDHHNSFGNRKDKEHISSFEKRNEQVDKHEGSGSVVHKAANKSFENKKPQDSPPKPKPKKPIEIVRADYPESGSIVAITAVIRPNKVFIRSMASEDNVAYVKDINRINNEAKNAKPLEKMPKRSDLAIADFQGEGYYRVCVLNPESEDRITVAYVDFGNVDTKKLSELKEIPEELISLKRHVLTLILKDVEDFEPSGKVSEYMNSFVDAVGKDLKLVFSERNEKGPLVAELIEVSTNESFNKMIKELREVKPATLVDEPVFSTDIKVKVLPPGEKTTLVVLDTSLIQTGAISCVLESDLGEIDRMTALFADYVKEAKGPYTPRPQEICLVQYDDGCWYRAECIEVVGDQNPSVLFIDFGNLTTAHIDKIRKYPRDLILPCVTATCLLAGIPEEINKTLADRLKELIPVNDKIIVDKVEAVDDQTNAIHLYDVVKTLKAENLF
ncbi:RING finger protein 17-like isoform X2 [Hermetia illucens]|uniref:RING finger protein 17-like isoform X2 n=1 Tax=Hermetia illucens TaxID=343691 RepID=UPI0018CC12DD|nr:RING finger protein 17-like isoform X2 [Hermetia illucens]